MRFIYTGLLYLICPFFILRLFWKSYRNPGYRERWIERLGFITGAPLKNTLWIHAVSVGEVQASQQLIKQLKQSFPDKSIVISTTTPTGAERAKQLFSEDLIHFYFPYDLPWVINRWLNHVNPHLLLMMETEIWPNLLRACEQRNILTLLANARMSEKSARGYQWLGQFSQNAFKSIDQVAAQSEADAQRFIDLGVSSEKIEVTGSIKFDAHQPVLVQEQAEVLRRIWGVDRPVWMAASTRDGEEEAILAAHKRVCAQIPEALLVLVPRHQERFDRVALLCKKRGFSLVRRSSQLSCLATDNIFLGDSMGELAVMYQAADLAFVGGSLVNAGGQNILEPASLGLPVLFGPSMYNFTAISDLFLQEQAAVQVDDVAALAEQVIYWLADASERTRVGENGRRVVEENKGAVDRLMKLILKLNSPG